MSRSMRAMAHQQWVSVKPSLFARRSWQRAAVRLVALIEPIEAARLGVGDQLLGLADHGLAGAEHQPAVRRHRRGSRSNASAFFSAQR